MTEIRRADPVDAAEMAAMRYDFRTELAEPNEPEPEFVERAKNWFEDRLAVGSWTGWLAAEPGRQQPVGMVLVQLIEKVPNPVVEPETLGYISCLYVRPPWRGRAIGDRLLATAVTFCRDNSVESVVLWPSPLSVPLYERHGFRPQAKVMELRLAVESSPGLRSAAGPTSLPLPRLAL
jgi:GNAT superfamily N-acetyltransferase